MCKENWPKAGVSAIIVEGDRILLVKRGTGAYRGLWSLPGGTIEPGEAIREALVRETREETGLDVEPGSVAGVFDAISRDAEGIRFHYLIITFHARIVSGQVAAASDAEDVRWVRFSELAAYPTTPYLVEELADLDLF